MKDEELKKVIDKTFKYIFEQLIYNCTDSIEMTINYDSFKAKYKIELIDIDYSL